MTTTPDTSVQPFEQRLSAKAMAAEDSQDQADLEGHRLHADPLGRSIGEFRRLDPFHAERPAGQVLAAEQQPGPDQDDQTAVVGHQRGHEIGRRGKG